MTGASIRSILTASLLLLATAGPAAAQSSQSLPSYAHPIPSLAPSSEETIRGRIESIPGPYQLEVRDDRGFIDNVALHQGTIINPTGLQLAIGMSVIISGTPQGKQFLANEIDTPYHETYPYLYPYPPYAPYPYPYWWGPSVYFHFGWR